MSTSPIKVRVKHTPATPPEFYRFEVDELARGYRMEGNPDRLWTAAEVLEAFDVVDRVDLYVVAKEARKELELTDAVPDPVVVTCARVAAVARAERARCAEALAPARAEPKRPEDSVTAEPAPAAGRKRRWSRE